MDEGSWCFHVLGGFWLGLVAPKHYLGLEIFLVGLVVGCPYFIPQGKLFAGDLGTAQVGLDWLTR